MHHLIPSRALRATVRQLAAAVAVVLTFAISSSPGAPAPALSEADAVRVLQSEAPLRDKDAACVRLKRVGTEASIPALAALLGDEQLSHSARDVLEAMSSPAAGAALVQAASRTTGSAKAGIIMSLGVRREPTAVPALAEALHGPDDVVANAAAKALGEIATPAARDVLVAADGNSSASRAVVDGLLRCAARMLTAGDSAGAHALYVRLHAAERADFVRAAAFRGLIFTSGPQGLTLACDAIRGAAGVDQFAALAAVHEITAPGATVAFARLLSKLAPTLQIALIEGLAQRDDPAAAPAIAALVRSSETDVRVAALRALGTLGDQTVVGMLAATAAATTSAEQAAARDSLVSLRRGAVGDGLLAQLPTARPAVQTEIARALAARRERAAVPKLEALAREGSAPARHAAIVALARLGYEEPTAIAALVNVIAQPKDAESRADAATALASACQNLQYRRAHIEPAPFLKALASGSKDARIALLPVLARLEDEAVADGLRRAAADRDAAISRAAILAMSDSRDVRLLPDLLKLSQSAATPDLRQACIVATVRLATDRAVSLPDAVRLETLAAVVSAAADATQRRVVIAGLADIPELDGIPLLRPMLNDAAVRDEAAAAIIKLSPFATDGGGATATLEQVRAAITDTALQSAADLALRQSAVQFGFITAWEVGTPYRQEGRDYAGLFELAFRPEWPEARGAAVPWRKAPAATDPSRPWRIDLRKPTGDEPAAVYARTRLISARAQPIQLEIGTDSGLKVWLNDKLLHANSQVRPFRPNADKITASLVPGVNVLQLKLVQPGKAGVFSVRVLQPDGAPLDGVQVSATPPVAN